MLFPLETFVQSIQEGGIYYFKCEELSSIEPHYFVVVKKYNDSMLLMLCATSQFERRRKYIENRGLPYSTLVWARPTAQNELKKDSYFDCNTSYFEFNVSYLANKYQSGELEVKGIMEEDVLEQIENGLKDSPLVEDEIKSLFED